LHTENGNDITEKPTNQRAMKKGTSIIKYVKDKHLRTTAKRAFHLWQIRPHEVAPLADTQCKCACCGTEFVGNFCPRCGQSASVNRFSLKQAIDLFLDVWDVNNRSVFRTMRDMLLRPGYMIRDYLNGMQAGYFSPFKMFFLLATLSLLVEHGFFYSPEAASDNTDIVSEMEAAAKGVKELREEKDSLALTSDKVETVSTTDEVSTASTTDEEEVNAASKADNDSISETEKIHKRLDSSSKDPKVQMIHKVGRMISKFADDNPALFTLILLVLFSLSLFVFFRHCPRYPNLRFSEFIAVLICAYNTYTLFMIIATLLDSTIIKIIAILMLLVSLHQFSGYSKRRIFGYLAVASIFWFILAVAIIASGIYFLAYK
jgi:hypothetical protein